jgi:hypothetical protein
MPSRSPAHRDLAVCGHGVRAAVVWPRFQAPTMPSPKQTTAADGPSRPRAPDQAVILVDLQDFTPSIKRTRPKTGEPSSISGRDRPEHLVVKTVGLADLAWASLLGVPGVRILLPPPASPLRTMTVGISSTVGWPQVGRHLARRRPAGSGSPTRHERAGFCCGKRIAGPNGDSQKGLFLMRYRWFESISLQRRVSCEPE